MYPYEELRLLLASMFEGEQRSGEVCPFCRGGRSGDKSLSIYKSSATSGAYSCKRAKCGKEGYIGERFGTHYTPENRNKEFQPRIYSGNVEEVPDVVREYYIAKYGFTEKDFRDSGCGWSPEYQRTVWAVTAPNHAVRGYELRSHRDEDRPKTLHYRHSPDPWVGYFGAAPTGNHVIVCVEDLISAYKVGQVYPCASLMGSHINYDIIIDLLAVSDNVVLCLDRDATTKAEKFVKRYQFICPNIVHVPLQQDLKYENKDQIKAIIEPALP